MKAEIIAIGSELLLGQIIDTNSSYIAKYLAENGIELVRITTVGDDLRRMKDAIQEAIRRSQIIITTGGIGPTEDDLTREAVAEVVQRPLVFQSHLMEQIEGLFQRRGFRMSENNRKQAYTPEGAIPIQNPKGTAPGFIVEGSDWVIISLPGVPLEMEYLMGNGVIPYLRKRFNLQQRVIKYEVLRACGLGESSLGLKIKDLMKEGQNPSVGTLASIGDIKIRITAKAADQEKASMMIKKVEQEIRDRLGILIYGMGNETLHGNVVKELERLSLTLSVVETITAGIISQKLGSTNSHSFVQGVLLPLNLSQMRFLNMGEEEFNALTQDQKKLSELSAIKAREKSKSDLGLGVFGKITEDQGKGEYRIETFHSLSTPNGTESQQHTVAGEPWMARERASIIALDMLRRHLLKIRQIL